MYDTRHGSKIKLSFYVVSLFLMVVLNAYFIHGLLSGQRRWIMKETHTQKLKKLQQENKAMLQKIQDMDRRITGVKQAIDPDLLEDLAWSSLGLVDARDLLVPRQA